MGSRFVWGPGVNQHGLPKREKQELTDQDEHVPQDNSQVQRWKNNNNIDLVSRDVDLVLDIQILKGMDHDCITCK